MMEKIIARNTPEALRATEARQARLDEAAKNLAVKDKAAEAKSRAADHRIRQNDLEWEARSEDWDSEREDLSRQIAALQEQLRGKAQHTQEEVSRLEGDNKDLQEENADLVRQNKQLRYEALDLRRANRKSAREARELDDLVQKGEMELQALQASSEQQILSADLECQALHSRITALQSDLQHTQTQLKDSQAALKDSETQLTGSQAEFKNCQQKLTDSQAEFKECQTQLKGSQAELKDCQRKFTDSQAEISDNQVELKNSQAKLEESQTALENSQAELQDCREKVEIQKQRHNHCFPEVVVDELLGQLGHELEEYQEILDRERLAHKQAQAQLELLSSTNQHLNEIIASKEARIEELEISQKTDQARITQIEQNARKQLSERNRLLLRVWQRLALLCGSDWQHQHNLVNNHLLTEEVVGTMLPDFSRNLMAAVGTVSSIITKQQSRVDAVRRDLSASYARLRKKLEVITQNIRQIEENYKAEQLAGTLSAVPELAKLRGENRLLKSELARIPPSARIPRTPGDHEMRSTFRIEALQRLVKTEREGRLLDRAGARLRLLEVEAENDLLRKELLTERQRR